MTATKDGPGAARDRGGYPPDHPSEEGNSVSFTTTTKPSVRQILDAGLDASTVGADEAVMLPPACYTDPEFFEFEKQALFLREWVCLGRTEQVANPGDYFTATIADEPLIVVRDTHGAVRVMSAVCRHRAMVITDPPAKPSERWWDTTPVESSGNCGHGFRCPYHFWTYNTEGRLIGAPDMERTKGFRKEDICLPQLGVEIWNNFIFANFDTGAPPLSPRLEKIETVIANWDIANMVQSTPEDLEALPWNWKVMFENFVEFYHSDRLHNRICAFSTSDSYIESPFAPDDAAIISAGRTTHPDFGFNPTFKALFPPIKTRTEDERALAAFFLVPPTLAFGVNSDSAFYFLLVPTAVDRLNIRVAGLYPRGYLDLPLFHELEAVSALGIDYFNQMDFAAVSSVQRGLRSRFAPRSQLCWQETPINQFHRWLVPRYESAS
ncbi:MAG: aromatic ring-hydroxylating dioxygenase subunit alpha [Actinobacteria bacterium]|nr:MAG: aromatic ring-hydroxylating dioxygenase subunit alpha [Actinomycetota bacterium]